MLSLNAEKWAGGGGGRLPCPPDRHPYNIYVPLVIAPDCASVAGFMNRRSSGTPT